MQPTCQHAHSERSGTPGGAASPVHRERMTACVHGRSRAKCRPLIGAADAAVVMATHARVGDPSRGMDGGAKEPCQGTAVDRRRRAAVVMATLREWVGGKTAKWCKSPRLSNPGLTRSGVRTVCGMPGAGRAWPLAITPGVCRAGWGCDHGALPVSLRGRGEQHRIRQYVRIETSAAKSQVLLLQDPVVLRVFSTHNPGQTTSCPYGSRAALKCGWNFVPVHAARCVLGVHI